MHLPPSKDIGVDWAAVADEEYANKKISTRILKHRAQPTAVFKAEEFKEQAMNNMAASGEITNFRNKMQSSRVLNSQQQQRTASQKSNRSKGSKSGVVSQQQNRTDNLRASRETALSGEPLSEKDRLEEADNVEEFLTDKEKLARQRAAEAKIVVTAKLTEERSMVRNQKI